MKTFGLLNLLMVFIFVLGCLVVNAQEGSDSLIGVISANRDANGAITSANLEAETYDESDNIVTLVYKIEMDDVGRQLAEKYDGAEVQITGTIKEATSDNKERSIVVKTFEGTSEEVPMEPEVDLVDPSTDVPDIDFGPEEGTEAGNEASN